MNSALVSSKNMNWRTPPGFLKLVREFSSTGRIGLDPCTTEDNPTEADHIFTPVEDGLVQDWSGKGLVFANPPYGRKLSPWAKKFASSSTGKEQLTLTPARVDTKWFRYMTSATRICFLYGRLQFHEQRPDGSWGPQLDEQGKPCSAPFPCAVSYWGTRIDDFRRVFGLYGWIVNPDAT